MQPFKNQLNLMLIMRNTANISALKMLSILVGYIQNNSLYLEPIATFKDHPTKRVIAIGKPVELYAQTAPITKRTLVLENIDTIC